MDIPDENAKGFLVAHLHQQRPNKKAQPLAVTDFMIV
jgi:hypothetical protein